MLLYFPSRVVCNVSALPVVKRGLHCKRSHKENSQILDTDTVGYEYVYSAHRNLNFVTVEVQLVLYQESVIEWPSKTAGSYTIDVL